MTWLQVQTAREWVYLSTLAAATMYFVVETVKGICYLRDRYKGKEPHGRL